MLVLTVTWTGGAPGTTQLAVAVKTAASYAAADLAGTWRGHALASGSGGVVTIDGRPGFRGSWTPARR